MIDKVTKCHAEHAPGDETGFNSAPVGWTEMTEAEFAKSMFFSYSPDYTEYRQILRLADGTPLDLPNGCLSVHMFWYWDKTGIAMHSDYWAGKVRYFRFGCAHEYVSIKTPPRPYSGLHTDKCKKCGQEWTYDTSD